MKQPLHTVMRGVVVACTLGVCAGAWAQADTFEARRTAALAVVKTLEALTGPERMMATMKGAMQAPILQQVRASTHLNITQQDRAAQVLVGELSAGMSELMQDVMPAVLTAMTEVYVERFTLAEIQDTQRFYESSAGRKSMSVMADDMPRLMQPVMQTLQARAPQLQRRVQAAVERLKQEGIDLRQPAR